MLNHYRLMLATNPRWQLRALKVLYDRQTAEEQTLGDTKEHNGIGFTGWDGKLLSRYAKDLKKYGSLTPGKMKVLAKRLPKYAKQLMAVAKQKGGDTTCLRR